MDYQDIIGLNLLHLSSNAPIKSRKAKYDPKYECDLGMSGGVHSSDWNANRNQTEQRVTCKEENTNFVTQSKKEPVKLENMQASQKYQQPYFEQKIDLDARGYNNLFSCKKKLDLNGQSW